MTWQDAWREGRTPWDAGKSPPILQQLLQELHPKPGSRALVPGCGAGWDVFTLARAGVRALGLDVAPVAIERFESLRGELGIPAENASAEVADFFSFTPTPFDLVWDYTFFCALQPERRGDWATALSRLVKPRGELWTLMFPVPANQTLPERPKGPPFPVTPALYAEHLEPHGFERLELREVRGSNPGREGKEWLARWQKR